MKKYIDIMRGTMTAYKVTEEQAQDLMAVAIEEGIPVVADPHNGEALYAYIEDDILGGVSVLRINSIFPHYSEYALDAM